MTATEARPVPARDLERTSRRPGAVVFGQAAGKAARSGALWGLVFALYILVQTRAYTSAYPSQAARDQMARAYSGNVGLNALLGAAREINTVSGYAAWRLLGILGVLGSLWGLLAATRLLRGEEEAGRYDLLLAGQTTRRRAAAQAVAGLGAGLAVLFAMTAAGSALTSRMAAVGFTVGQSLYFAVTLVAPAAVFLAVGVLASQVVGTRRQAVTLAGTVFGVCYALRMLADSASGLAWLAWLSPLGWIEESRPLTGPRPLALLPVVALVVIVTGAALHLAGRRDLGAATWRGRETSAAHYTLVGGPLSLGIRLARATDLSWLAGLVVFALLLGTVAESSAGDATGDRSVRKALAQLGGHGSAVTAYLGLTFLVLALLIALIAGAQVTAMRNEEASGHLENLLVRPVSRARWLSGRLLLSACVLLAAGLLAGAAAWAGAASQHGDVRLGLLLSAGLNLVPPALLLLGLGALAFGAWPRRAAALVYGYLTWSFLVEFTGAVVHISHWVLDTSVFFHVAPAPAANPDWVSAAVLTGIGVAGALAGTFLFGRRDVLGA